MEVHRWPRRSTLHWRLGGQTVAALEKKVRDLQLQKQQLEVELAAAPGDLERIRLLSGVEDELYTTNQILLALRREEYERKERMAVGLLREELAEREFKAANPEVAPAIAYGAALEEIKVKRAEYLSALRKAAILEQHPGWSQGAMANGLVQRAREMESTTDFLYENLGPVNREYFKAVAMRGFEALPENRQKVLRAEFPRYFAPLPPSALSNFFSTLRDTLVVRAGGRQRPKLRKK